MIPAMREQFGDGCRFVEAKQRYGDRGEGITFMVEVEKTHHGAYRKGVVRKGRAVTRDIFL